MPTLANALKHSTLNEPNTITYEEDSEGGGGITTNHGPNTRVGLITHKAGNGIATRVNNLYSYLEINRRVRRGEEFSPQEAAANKSDLVLGTGSSEPVRASGEGAAD
jgi:hypothetical protein